MSEPHSTRPFFPREALIDPTHPAWAPIFRRLSFLSTRSEDPHVGIAASACTPEDLLSVTRSPRPITCDHLVWTGELRDTRAVLHLSGYGLRSALRLMWAWYYRQPPPDWSQIVHAPAQKFARTFDETAHLGCLGNHGAFHWDDKWRPCVYPWCLRVEPILKYIYDRNLREESRLLNQQIDFDIYRSHGFYHG